MADAMEEEAALFEALEKEFKTEEKSRVIKFTLLALLGLVMLISGVIITQVLGTLLGVSGFTFMLFGIYKIIERVGP